MCLLNLSDPLRIKAAAMFPSTALSGNASDSSINQVVISDLFGPTTESAIMRATAKINSSINSDGDDKTELGESDIEPGTLPWQGERLDRFTAAVEAAHPSSAAQHLNSARFVINDLFQGQASTSLIVQEAIRRQDSSTYLTASKYLGGQLQPLKLNTHSNRRNEHQQAQL